MGLPGEGIEIDVIPEEQPAIAPPIEKPIEAPKEPVPA